MPSFEDKTNSVFQLLKEKKYHQAEQLLLESLSLIPENTFLKSLLANVLLKQHRIAESLALADDVLARENNPEALATKGLALIESKQLDAGIECLESSLTQRENFFYRSRLVQTLLNRKRIEEAEINLKVLLEAEPNKGFHRKLQAKLLALKGKEKEALDTLHPAGESPPDDPFEYSQFLRLKIKTKPVPKALSELQTLASLPQHRENPHLITLIGECQTKSRFYVEAEKSFQQAAQLLPQNDYIKQKLGFLYSKMKQYHRVIDIFKPLFLKQPGDLYVRKTLELAFNKSNRNQELEKILEQAIIEHPEIKQLHGILKRTQRKLQAPNIKKEDY
ncbi:hypothetical protein ACFL27_11245 [candidate division CSSED10-310 bacterium]|uniref:Tetratricopeptide repeat protein n=1 Tax=candidate division CSSED10-310 bacterium TaxID=2855610 RepID=A0ABV6YX49_UNCC1